MNLYRLFLGAHGARGDRGHVQRRSAALILCSEALYGLKRCTVI
jgi:hypothetical protein